MICSKSIIRIFKDFLILLNKEPEESRMYSTSTCRYNGTKLWLCLCNNQLSMQISPEISELLFVLSYIMVHKHKLVCVCTPFGCWGSDNGRLAMPVLFGVWLEGITVLILGQCLPAQINILGTAISHTLEI